MRRDLTLIVNSIIFLVATFLSIYFIVFSQPTIIEDLPGKKTIEYSSAAIIAPLVATGYFLLIINDINETPFKIRNIPFRYHLMTVKQKFSEGIQKYHQWRWEMRLRKK